MTSQPTDRVLIIPAAGAGVRFRELGKNYPKCILPVQGTPIIVTAIRELADKTGAFKKVIVAAGSSAHAQDIRDALAPFNLKTEVVVRDIQVPYWLQPSPAVSLNQILWTAIHDRGRAGDVDVTIFLSDMLPRDERIVKAVVEMPADTWGVVEKKPDDYKRWCMVEPNRGVLTFYDKPVNQPPTRFAAVGVYRYSSAKAMVAAFNELTKGYDGDRVTCHRELQFSEVAEIYQREHHRIAMDVFKDSSFVDFGTLEEYLANKGINKCRSFNKISENRALNTVTKSSHLYSKIKDEAVWLLNAPGRIKKYLPTVHEADIMRGSITMEKIRSSNLRDVALYLDRSYDTWVEIFKEIKQYLDMTEMYGINPYGGDIEDSNKEFWEKMWKKTEDRIDDIKMLTPEQRCDAYQWLCNDFAETSANFMKYPEQMDDFDHAGDRIVYMHGDLHFANMFYCFHYKDLKVIDPRGDVRGSIYYDLAKLCHSVYGRYDYIDAELYRIGDEGTPQYYSKGHENIERAFNDVIFSNLPKDVQVDVMRLTASLFLSMIPLHADKPDHQALFYTEFKRLAGLANAMKTA